MIAENLGRLFEVAFNIGILAYIEQNCIPHNFGNLYRGDLQRLKFPEMLKRILEGENLISQTNIQIVEKWSLYFLQKGFLSGLNFFGEYIKSTGWKSTKLSPIEILYYQCSFCANNSIKTYPKSELREYRELLSQFDSSINSAYIDRYIHQYRQKGEFLKADTLMLLRHREKFRILTVDLSIFSVKSAKDLLDLEDQNLQNQRRLLRREISYLSSKSVFSKLRIDTGDTKGLDFNFSEDLTRYFTAFKREDKESAKLIQAGSYTYSLYKFLKETKILADNAPVVFNVVGYSDRSLSTLSLHPDNLKVLETCSRIYKNEPREQEIIQARQQVLKLIQLNAERSFSEGRKFVKQLLNIPSDTLTCISHEERLDGFSSTLALRHPHAELIKKALVSDDTYLFLTGNPGIGKTTAIVEFLKTHISEGFLFFYVSPRQQVNLDIIEKFKDEKTGELSDNRLFCINTNSQIIRENFSRSVVNYFSNQYQGDFTQNGVTFLDASQAIERKVSRQHAVKRMTEDEIRATKQKGCGVLFSLCEAIYTTMNRNISNNIVATACIQSFKITENGIHTVNHFKNIFKGVSNKQNGTIIPAKIKEISSRMKHLFIMIDEITGDDSGVNFLKEIGSILKNYELTDGKHGFNTKVIVADASIVDADVIKQHLAETSPEPDKIFFRRASEEMVKPLGVQSFKFKGSNATAINANSYPAGSLAVKYQVFVESLKFNEETFTTQKDSLKNKMQSQIVADINHLWEQPDAGQILVYIQDKRRLQTLISQIKNQRELFEKNEDYLEIHASISETERQEIERHKNNVKVVFMTSSASRGLSFPKAKHILVEIPRFQVESNLMEIVQVIYRGRGYYIENGERKTLDESEKELIFYLGDRAVYYEQEKALSLQESVLNLLNILLIVKTCMMTRIQGAGQLGRVHDKFLMIPIGGKSVSAAGQTFSSQMANLLKDLKNEYRRRPNHLLLKQVYLSLEHLLSRAEFRLIPAHESRQSGARSHEYLRLREVFNRQFSQLIADGFDRLLDFGNIELGHITGSLLVVPIAEQRLEETYEIRLMDIATHASQDLLNQMLNISLSSDYPPNLRAAIKDAIDLIDQLREPINKTQWLEQSSQQLDQYYALPLFSFITGEAMRQYFADEPEEPEDERFRDILATYIHHLYPADKTLPIGHQYRDFPFVVFRSYSLEAMREKILTDKYLLTSNELNVLNLVLSKSETADRTP